MSHEKAIRFQHKDFDLRLDDLLGQGANTAIYLGKHKRKPGVKFAIKLYEREHEKETETRMLTEIVTLAAGSDAINKFIMLEDHGSEPPVPYCVFEYCSKTLKYHVQEEILPEELMNSIRNIMAIHLFPALKFLHDNEIIHGDIKAENIMFSNKHWKLIDFGCSTYSGAPAHGGTYVAPELVRAMQKNRPYTNSTAVDAFALGIMIMEMFAGFPVPSYWEDIKDLADFSDYNSSFPMHVSVPQAMQEKLALLILKNPDSRLRISAFSQVSVFKTNTTKDYEDEKTKKIILTFKQNSSAVLDAVDNVHKDVRHTINQNNQIFQNTTVIMNLQLELRSQMDSLLTNVTEFLPAIQENLMQALSTTAVPNKFVLLPVKQNSFKEAFFKKFKLSFICENGQHLCEEEGDGYSIVQITSLGKAVILMAQLLISVAIKHLVGDVGSGAIREITRNIMNLSGLQEGSPAFKMAMDHLVAKTTSDTSMEKLSTTAAQESFLTMSRAAVDLCSNIADFTREDFAQVGTPHSEADWIKVFAPLKPVIKDFLQGKDLTKMGVQQCRERNGKMVWVCKHHAKFYDNIIYTAARQQPIFVTTPVIPNQEQPDHDPALKPTQSHTLQEYSYSLQDSLPQLPKKSGKITINSAEAYSSLVERLSHGHSTFVLREKEVDMEASVDEVVDIECKKIAGPPLPRRGLEKLGKTTQLILSHIDMGIQPQLPDSLGQMKKLTKIKIVYSGVIGNIPSSLGDLPFLKSLNLERNKLIGAVPLAIFKLENLTELYLAGNQLNSQIPKEILNLKKLKHLDLSNNYFFGEIPKELSKISTLISVDLSSNKLTGKVPAALLDCEELEQLTLDGNNLSGPLHSELAAKFSNLDWIK